MHRILSGTGGMRSSSTCGANGRHGVGRNGDEQREDSMVQLLTVVAVVVVVVGDCVDFRQSSAVSQLAPVGRAHRSNLSIGLQQSPFPAGSVGHSREERASECPPPACSASQSRSCSPTARTAARSPPSLPRRPTVARCRRFCRVSRVTWPDRLRRCRTVSLAFGISSSLCACWVPTSLLRVASLWPREWRR
ncbi:hypothetical protein AMAG_17722 [Allomyces macrogynus ATCC 38327]|uniref:Uncharacterized protein n=1 Tax=Allomyces macrogynus (strain ATCC 38327) TaxID=578462 RepID=A0A0L0RX73_ALLM3|nr:hypothetical protein AMAG_17722 [Allomyces macrogynus ATCC 38327]|eukprot:KNE54943.1 hypothetical protein AMAG_17722 [Allomyces macrogynus ATCC 38327]